MHETHPGDHPGTWDRDISIARLRELADHVEAAQHVATITHWTPKSPQRHVDGFNMSHYAVTDDGGSLALDTECSTVACLGGYACSRWGNPRPWTWNQSQGAEALALKRNVAEALFSPRYLEATARARELSQIRPAEAARACRRLANLLENAPEELEQPHHTRTAERNAWERRLTDALWGEELTEEVTS